MFHQDMPLVNSLLLFFFGLEGLDEKFLCMFYIYIYIFDCLLLKSVTELN